MAAVSVDTNTPSSIKKLYKQRLRWIYGFINNTIDYRSVLFRKKYGNFALFTLPTGLVSIFAASFLFGKMIYSFGDFVYSKIVAFDAVGWRLSYRLSGFDLFLIDTHSSMFLIFFIYSAIIFAIIFGRKMVEGKWTLSLSMIYYVLLFRVLAPIWLVHAIYNTIISKKPAWR